jgi:pilus assembly protein Flp/PilA
MVRPQRDERGASATEAGLLMAAVAVVVLPVVFVVGHLLQGVFDDTCKAIATSSCEQARGGPGQTGQGGGGGSGPAQATQALEAKVADQLTDPRRGAPSVTCNMLPSAPPPAGTRTRCAVRYGTGPTSQVVVTFIDDNGNFRIG